MFGINPAMLLLQIRSGDKLFKEDNPREALIVLIGIGVVVVIALLYRLIRNGVGSPAVGKGGKSGGGGSTPRKFNAFALYRIAAAYGLDRDQSKLLEYVFRNDSVADPERSMKTPALLDRHFKRAYRAIERNSETEEDTQQKLVSLFSLRNFIEASPGAEDSPPSAKIAENTPAVLVNGKDSYPVKVLKSGNQQIITEIPRNALGTPVRLSKGTRITLSFFTKSSKGFSFDGHVMGIADTEQGSVLHISHTGKIKQLTKRKFRRRQTAIRCEFFHVFLEESESGKKKAPKLIVDAKRFTGTVLDVSIGGCSIKTASSIQVGSRLKISIDYDDSNLINTLGQVLRTNRSGAAASIIHIKFLKVPRRAFNSISAIVFGYDDV